MPYVNKNIESVNFFETAIINSGNCKFSLVGNFIGCIIPQKKGEERIAYFKVQPVCHYLRYQHIRIQFPIIIGQNPINQKFFKWRPIIVCANTFGDNALKSFFCSNDTRLGCYGLYMYNAVNTFKFRIEILLGTNRHDRDFRIIIIVIVDLNMTVKGGDFFSNLLL